MVLNIKTGEIPKGWAICALPDFTRIVMGQSPSSDTYNYVGEGIPFYQGKAEFGDIYPEIDKYCSQPNKIAEAGATLLSVRAPVGPTNLAQQRCGIGRGLAAIHPLDNIDSMFVLFLYRSIETDIADKGTGSTFTAITKNFVEEMKFALPPLNEQRRIVAKIEVLFSELDKGVESLKTAREQLKVYRQAVLKHAFEGKLTAQWREANRDKLETPDQLLARIQAERDARYQQQVEDWEVAVKEWEAKERKDNKPRKPTSPPFFTVASDKSAANLLILPVDWLYLPLESLAAEAVLGKMLDKEKNKGAERRYLGNINLRWGAFDLEHLKFMRIEEGEIPRYSLKRGDLVICEGGEPGRCAVWEGENDVMFIQKALHRVRFTKSLDPYFAYYYMLFATTSGLLERNFTGTTIKHLTGTGLGRIMFPLCSLSEQMEIVKGLETTLSRIEACETEINDNLSRTNALRQSILKKAFSGQLVPQDPNDEPASALLERIRAEKAEHATGGKQKTEPAYRQLSF